MCIIQKAVQRRVSHRFNTFQAHMWIYFLNKIEAAAKFSKGSRPDLAEMEQEEALLLSKFLPQQLSTSEIDTQLIAIMDALPKDLDSRKSIGMIFKEFYSKVDKSSIDANLVKRRTQDLMKSVTP